MMCVFRRKLWLSILAWTVMGTGIALAITPVYSDIYGTAK